MLCYDITYVFLTLKGLGPCQTFKISPFRQTIEMENHENIVSWGKSTFQTNFISIRLAVAFLFPTANKIHKVKL